MRQPCVLKTELTYTAAAETQHLHAKGKGRNLIYGLASCTTRAVHMPASELRVSLRRFNGTQ